MSVTLIDFLNFPFNGGKGIRTNQLSGPFVKSIASDGTATLQGSDDTESTVDLGDLVEAGPARERIVRPWAGATATTGVRNMNLPTDYADYEWAEWGVSDPDQNATDFVRRRCSWLAARTDAENTRIAVLDGNESGSRQFLAWTPSTRGVACVSQSATPAENDLRIQSFRLYDTQVTSAETSGGLSPDQEAKLGRYPDNPAATPAAHLEPYSLVGDYSTATYVQVAFDSFNIDPGKVMIAPASQGGTRHGVVIGLRPEDLDSVDYVEVGLSFMMLRASDNGVIASGNAASVSSNAGNTVLLVSISDHTVVSFGADVPVRIEFGNKIALQINNNSQNITQLETNDQALRATLLALQNAFPDPITPSHQGTARILGLGLPANSGRTTWEDITDSLGGGGSGGTDTTARAAAGAAQTAADNAQTSATAAAGAAAGAQTTADNALERTAIFSPLSVWEMTQAARTLQFEYRPLEAVHTSVNATVVVGGSTINNVNPSEGLSALDDVGIVLNVPITQTQARNISGSSAARSGYVRCQITAGSADTITGWMRTEAVSGITAADVALTRRRNPTTTITLTDAATVEWNSNLGLMARVVLGGNRTLGNPTNVMTGDVLVVEVVQDATGGRTLGFGNSFIGPAVALEAGANEVTVLTFLALSPNRLLRGPAVPGQ